MEIHQQPSILKEASGANPKINFLVGCLQYDKSSRPSIQVLTKNLNHALHSGNQTRMNNHMICKINNVKDFFQ